MTDRTQSGVRQDVLLNDLPLRIATNAEGVLQYNEEVRPGPEMLNPADGFRFSDVFSTWHLGAYMKEGVQPGFYHRGRNVNCMAPYKITPAPPLKNSTAYTVSSNDMFGVGGFAFDKARNRLIAIVRYSNAGVVPNSARLFWINDSYAQDTGKANNNTALSTDMNISGTNGYAGSMKPILLTRSGVREWVVPLGDDYILFTTSNGTKRNLSALGFHVAGGRIYKLTRSSTGQIGISNCDATADYDNTANWTTPVYSDVYDGTQLLETTEIDRTGSSINAIEGIPIMGTPEGILVLDTGGLPTNITPQFKSLPQGKANFKALSGAQGGLVTGIYGLGHILLFGFGGGTWVGPSRNPLLDIEDNWYIWEITESPRGDLWALVGTETGGEVKMVVGVKSEGGYNWHDLWSFNEYFSTAQGNFASAPPTFLPFVWADGDNDIAIGLPDSNSAASQILIMDGDLFYSHTSTAFEGSDSYEVSWESGRYWRNTPGLLRYWDRVRFICENVGAAAGGTVSVLARLHEESGYTNIGTITADIDEISIDGISQSVELKLVWGLGGAADTTTPVTIKQIHFLGREVPPRVRVITMLVSGWGAQQAGGVRSKHYGTSLLDAVESLSNGPAVPFVGPFKEKAVQVLQPVQLTNLQCQRQRVPEGTIAVTVIEAESFEFEADTPPPIME